MNPSHQARVSMLGQTVKSLDDTFEIRHFHARPSRFELVDQARVTTGDKCRHQCFTAAKMMEDCWMRDAELGRDVLQPDALRPRSN